MTTFGERVKTERKRLGLTQNALCAQTGMSQSNLSSIESDGVPSSTYTPAMAAVFGVEALWLADGKLPRTRIAASINLDISSTDGYLARKTPQPARNPNASKALFDLARELERGDLPKEAQSLLVQEFEAKIKFVRATMAKLNRESKPND